MKKSGKIGRANQRSRKIIAAICEERGLDHCEIGFEGCKGYMFLAPAHKHKRVYYAGDVARLSDYNEWVVACVSCHDKIEISKKLTEETFNRLRPNNENRNTKP